MMLNIERKRLMLPPAPTPYAGDDVDVVLYAPLPHYVDIWREAVTPDYVTCCRAITPLYYAAVAGRRYAA